MAEKKIMSWCVLWSYISESDQENQEVVENNPDLFMCVLWEL